MPLHHLGQARFDVVDCADGDGVEFLDLQPASVFAKGYVLARETHVRANKYICSAGDTDGGEFANRISKAYLIARVRVRHQAMTLDVVRGEHMGSVACEVVSLVGDVERVYLSANVDSSDYICMTEWMPGLCEGWCRDGHYFVSCCHVRPP